MTWSFWVAIVVVIATVYALIKRYETRLVLLTSGFVMAFISLQPMIAFKQFDKSMTNGSLIIAICSALGFAAVISLTKCDVHLVSLLMRPLKKTRRVPSSFLHDRHQRDCHRHSFYGRSVCCRRSDNDSDHDQKRFQTRYRCRSSRRLHDAGLFEPGRFS